MLKLFPPIFESIWKRKETKIYLVFTLWPAVALISSFFEKANFMKLTVEEGYLAGAFAMFDGWFAITNDLMLPVIALYFLTLSVFRRETDDHTMFLYKDINKTFIFWAKFLSLISIVFIYTGIFIVTSIIVHYTRFAYLETGTTRFWEPTLQETISSAYSSISVILQNIVSIILATFLSLNFKTGTTMVMSVCVTIASAITPLLGEPFSFIFPNGFKDLAWEGIGASFQAIGIALLITAIYFIVFTPFSLKKFKSIEF